MSASASWVKINDFVMDCGSVRVAKDFSINVLNTIDRLVPYDHARLFLINDNSCVYDAYVLGIDNQWIRAYLEYYSSLENGRYSIFGKSIRNGNYTYEKKTEQRVRNWVDSAPDEFITNYVRPLGLKYSLGFNLHDFHNAAKSLFVLDRVTNVEFSKQELETMTIICTHLENLHRNFYAPPPNEYTATNKIKSTAPLTRRETELAELIVRGVSTAGISKKLCISTTTVYKHISNIYEKLNITSRQELTIKLLGLESD